MPLKAGFTLHTEMPGKAEYLALFESTGWNREYAMTSDEFYQAVRNSWRLVAVYDRDKLIGSGRVVSDGVFHALIVDVIVLPEYQGKGIGSAIMKALLEQCRASRIRDIQLFSATGKAPFYQRLGFRERSPDAPGMDYKPAATG